MKLLLSLFWTLISLLLLVAVAYLLLPVVLSSMIRAQLENQGFSNVLITELLVGPESTSIGMLSMQNDAMQADIEGIQLSYDWRMLLQGKLERVRVDEISVVMVSRPDSGFSLPDPLVLSGMLGLLQAGNLPVRSASLGRMIVKDDRAKPLLDASGSLLRAGQGLTGQFRVKDAQAREIILKLFAMADSGSTLRVYLADDLQNPALTLTAQIQSAEQGVDGTLRAQLSPILEYFDQAGLSANVDASYSYVVGSDPASPRFTLSLQTDDLKLDTAQVQQMQLQASGSLSKQDEDAIRVSLDPQSTLSLRGLMQADMTADGIRLEFPPSLQLSASGLRIDSDQGAGLTLENLRNGDLRLQQARIENIGLDVRAIQGRASRCRVSASISTRGLLLAGADIKAEKLQLSGDCPLPGQSAWEFEVNSPGLSYEDKQLKFSLESCRLNIGNRRDGQLIKAGQPLELGGSARCAASGISGGVGSDFRFNPVNKVGKAEFFVEDIRPDSDRPLIGSILKDWNMPFEIVTGSIGAKGVYRWWTGSAGRPRQNLSVDLQAQDLGGHYADILFSGMSYGDSIELLPTLRSSKSAPLNIESIDIGIPVSDLSTQLQILPSQLGPLPRLSLRDLQTSLLGGKLSATLLQFDLNADVHDFEVDVVGLDLAELVALQKMDGLSASGRLDGTIPVHISPAGVTIKAGKIIGEKQGGHIQYIPSQAVDATQSTVPGSQRVMQVLEDLRYDSLDIDVDFSEQGDLKMRLALKGISPSVDPRRPVHFNLTLEQNLLTLLRGLRYAEGINEDIDRNVQKHFKNRN